jgi:flagellar capping protein FliD
MKNELTRRGALRSAAAGIAVLGATGGSVAAQDATPSAGADGLSRLELARLAGELRAALVPVVASLRAQTEDELTESAKTYVEQLQEQQNVTEDEAGTLQQIIDEAGSEDNDQTRVEKIQAIVNKLTEAEINLDSSLVAIGSLAAAMVSRKSDETPSTETDDADVWHRIKLGIVGALAGAAIGGAIAGEDGSVIGAVAGALAAAV